MIAATTARKRAFAGDVNSYIDWPIEYLWGRGLYGSSQRPAYMRAGQNPNGLSNFMPENTNHRKGRQRNAGAKTKQQQRNKKNQEAREKGRHAPYM